jgi:hypothetical protein
VASPLFPSKVAFLQDSANRAQWTSIQFSLPLALCVWSYVALCTSSAFGMGLVETRMPTIIITAALTCVGAIRMYCFASESSVGLGGHATRAAFSSDRHLAMELARIILPFGRILRRNLLRPVKRRLGTLVRHVLPSNTPTVSPV